MTEDNRVARNPGEPAKDGPAGAVRWAAYLDWVREEIVDAVLALPETERRTSRLPSGWTPVELLSHVLHMEQRWFVWGFLGEQVAEPWGDWTVDEPWDEGAEGRWHVPADTTAEELVARLRAVGERTRVGAARTSRSTRRRHRVGGSRTTRRAWSGSASTCSRSTPGMRGTSTSRSSWRARSRWAGNEKDPPDASPRSIERVLPP